MTLRTDMLAASRRGRGLWPGGPAGVEAFFRSRLDPGGGFRGRGEAPDLYYTVFGVEGLMAAGGRLPDRLPEYLRSFGSGEGLDLVHLGCLARLWADLGGDACDPGVRRAMLGRLETFRTADGGFSHLPAADGASAYGCFLAVGAYEDLGAGRPDPARLIEVIESFRAADGGYANEPDRPSGLAPAGAAAATVLERLGRPVEDSVLQWLVARQHEEGGFAAFEGAPIPDLLSTATVLHALAGAGKGTGGAGAHLGAAAREDCRGFIRSLWCEPGGGFRGHWLDDAADCEYTWYGLLALGHLADG